MGRSVAGDTENDLGTRNSLCMEHVGREIECTRGRAFASNTSCLCCMGGNCHVIGHVRGDCQCCWLPRASVRSKRRGDLEWIQAQTFKHDYVQREEKYRENMNKRAGLGILRVSYLGEIQVCRRFINDGAFRCRVELGNCRRDECRECFQKEQKWLRGESFV